MTHPIKRIETAKQGHKQNDLRRMKQILLTIYPPTAEVVFTEKPRQIEVTMKLFNFIDWLEETENLRIVLGIGNADNLYSVMDSETLRYTQISNSWLTASLWKQPRRLDWVAEIEKLKGGETNE